MQTGATNLLNIVIAARCGKHRSARVTRPNVSGQEERLFRTAFCPFFLVSSVLSEASGECGHAKLCQDA